MVENRKLKLNLQSFSPLFLILFIKYFDVKEFIDCFGANFGTQFIYLFEKSNKFTLAIDLVCVLWILFFIRSILLFKDTQNKLFHDLGYQIKIESNENGAGIAFFATYVLPLLFDNINTSRMFLIFSLILFMEIMLMWKSNLFYQNPILIIFGYRIYTFAFTKVDNNSLYGKTYIGICHGKLQDSIRVKLKYISDNVFLIKNA